jgi:pyridoxamine 5'-phosphate oxidase family protein
MAVMVLELSAAERDCLLGQRLGRLASIDAHGQPQNNPFGFYLNDELGVIDIGGRAMGQTKKFRNARSNPLLSLVADDLASVRPLVRAWRRDPRPRRALSDWQPPYPYYSREAIRIHPTKIISWGLDPD